MTIEFNCPTCGSQLRAPDEYAGKPAKCKSCQSKVIIPLELDTGLIIDSEACKNTLESDYHKRLKKSGFPSTLYDSLISKLSTNEAKMIWDWANERSDLKNDESFTIKQVKYEGHLLIMTDGSRWEVVEDDTYISDGWSAGDKIVFVNNRMCRLEDVESIGVRRE